MVLVDRDLRDWLRSLAVHHEAGSSPTGAELSDEGAQYLARIAADGTLASALAEIAATEPQLAG